MKTTLTIALSLAACLSLRAQTLSGYQSTVSGQNPNYYFNFDNSLSSVGASATFSPNPAYGGFTNDYFGNAGRAAFFSASSDQLALASPDIINGSGNVTAVGSLSLLFYTPNTTLSGTQYILSDGETSGSEFAVELTGGILQVKAVNKTLNLTASSLTGGTWYYLALTWNMGGSAVGVNGLNYYLGMAGQNNFLNSGFFQQGGSGNISSTGDFGDAGTVTLSGHQTSNSGGFALAGNYGAVDELAAWNSQLTSGQINNQFDALQPVPEPATAALLGVSATLLALCGRRRN